MYSCYATSSPLWLLLLIFIPLHSPRSPRVHDSEAMGDYAKELLRRQLNGGRHATCVLCIEVAFMLLCLCLINLFSSAELNRNPPDGVSVGLVDDSNIFLWELMVMGPPDTLYEGGFFKAKLDFPSDFPNNPPTMTFTSEMWHPNGMCYMFLFFYLFFFNGSLTPCFAFALLQCMRMAAFASPYYTPLERTSSMNKKQRRNVGDPFWVLRALLSVS